MAATDQLQTFLCVTLLSTLYLTASSVLTLIFIPTENIMEDELMFSMEEEEEEEGSGRRPPVQTRRSNLRTSSLSDPNASDDDHDEEDNYIYPILHDSAKEICQYLTGLVNTQQQSNSLPKSNFKYRVSKYDTCYTILPVSTCCI